MRKHIVLNFLIVLVLILSVPSSAADITVSPENSFCFSHADFATSDADDGIFITSVPSKNIANIRYGSRILRAGDALPADALNTLTLETSCITEQDVQVEYCTISDGKITGTKALFLSIRPPKNKAPVAEDSNLETYKNISNDGKLDVSDPENGKMTFELIKEPKRGHVVLHNDGTFTYTPKENKVGKDSFVYRASDEAGNVSNEATVFIKILKPTDKAIYSDMVHDQDQFLAMWLKEKDLYQGATIAGKLCFAPDQSVSRGEFLIMAMRLVQADQSLLDTASGFADESSTPKWMQPYITTALSNGMITGTGTEDGVIFRPMDVMTKAEALVMMQNILQIPADLPVSSMYPQKEENDCTPTWALNAHQAMSQIGVTVDILQEDAPLTRRDAAHILYQTNCFMLKEDISAFYWQE